MLGRTIVPSEQASALGDVGDINLWNLDQYLWIRKGGIAAATSIHVQFLTGETAFRFVVRANGQPIPNAAITPFKGTSTQSPFVSLAAR
jgi:HK97 family phage major capsid protein